MKSYILTHLKLFLSHKQNKFWEHMYILICKYIIEVCISKREITATCIEISTLPQITLNLIIKKKFFFVLTCIQLEIYYKYLFFLLPKS